jgi:hypothetical protein
MNSGVGMMVVQGAAISLQGQNFAVVVVGPELLGSPGEADLAIETMQPAFGGVPVVLMAQKEDDSPMYYGDQDLLQLLRDLPIDQMPWREYTVAG